MSLSNRCSQVTENWRPIAGWEGRYEASDLGHVRNARTGRRVAGWVNPAHGYTQISLHRPKTEGRPISYRLHRLIAIAWIPNPEGKSEVNHKDLDPTNNAVSNLEWMTKRENIDHAIANGHYDPTKHHKRLKRLTLEDVEFIRAAEGTMTTKQLCERYNVTAGHIRRIQTGYNFRATAPVPWQRSGKRIPLTDETVLAIRRLAAEGLDAASVARRLGVAWSRVHGVLNKGRYAHVLPREHSVVQQVDAENVLEQKADRQDG